MVSLCPSNGLSFMFSMALLLSKSVYLTLLSLGTCPGQTSAGEWSNELPGGFPHSHYTHGCIGTVDKCNCCCSTSGTARLISCLKLYWVAWE